MATQTWADTRKIISKLKIFLQIGHFYFPYGGWEYAKAVKQSCESGCISFRFGDDSGAVVKPKCLVLEYLDSTQSFFLLELDPLKPTGLAQGILDEFETVVDSAGSYLHKDAWPSGTINQNGVRVPSLRSRRL